MPLTTDQNAARSVCSPQVFASTTVPANFKKAVAERLRAQRTRPRVVLRVRYHVELYLALYTWSTLPLHARQEVVPLPQKGEVTNQNNLLWPVIADNNIGTMPMCQSDCFVKRKFCKDEGVGKVQLPMAGKLLETDDSSETSSDCCVSTHTGSSIVCLRAIQGIVCPPPGTGQQSDVTRESFLRFAPALGMFP